ncbi:hypothetical protein BLOT_002619 [Blomia tropicalis]|nr:hypothetical protein BLOT_002619 [Blomia tropicalis]
MRPPMVVAASLTITDLAAVTIELHPTKRIESYDESYNTFNNKTYKRDPIQRHCFVQNGNFLNPNQIELRGRIRPMLEHNRYSYARANFYCVSIFLNMLIYLILEEIFSDAMNT